MISLLSGLRITPPEGYDWSTHADGYELYDTLQAMGEPTLEPGSGADSYRFVWLRSFDEPIAIRVASRDQAAVLDVSRLQRSADGALKAVHSPEIRLTASQWSALQAAIDRVGFWHMPSDDERFGFDGAQWILQGVHGYRYHTVYRWSPDEGDAFRTACLKLVEYSAVQVDPEDIY
jgi:hypothetical protein